MRQKTKIGVMGSAQGPTTGRNEGILKSQELGKWIAKLDCILVNGACPGLPNEAAIGAKENGGFVVGISPAFSEQEHIEIYKSPSSEYDIILYTGQGLMGRDVTNIRSSDAICLVGGGVGTLNEFVVAYDEQKLVGVLTGTGGVADNLPEILKICNREVTNRIIFESDPKTLVEKMVLALREMPQPEFADERVIKGTDLN
ncbi:hypothetical protein LR002_03125 [Candidatus Gracilibacteria bacterium]|nr:hypothetical protein [Candidatus Gracilibacteria bacterium]